MSYDKCYGLGCTVDHVGPRTSVGNKPPAPGVERGTTKGEGMAKRPQIKDPEARFQNEARKTDLRWLEMKISDLQRRLTVLEDKVWPAQWGPRRIYFKDGPLSGETKTVDDWVPEYKAPLAPAYVPWGSMGGVPVKSYHLVIALYRQFAPLDSGVWEYRLAGYECSGDH